MSQVENQLHKCTLLCYYYVDALHIYLDIQVLHFDRERLGSSPWSNIMNWRWLGKGNCCTALCETQ